MVGLSACCAALSSALIQKEAEPVDSSAILWILAWSGVLSIAIFVVTGILGQLLPLIEAWRAVVQTLKGGYRRAPGGRSGPASHIANEPEMPAQLPAGPDDSTPSERRRAVAGATSEPSPQHPCTREFTDFFRAAPPAKAANPIASASGRRGPRRAGRRRSAAVPIRRTGPQG